MNGLVGFRPLLKVTIKQDARNIAPWIVLITFLSVTSIVAYIWIFTDQTSRAQLSAAVGVNPAMSLIFGKPGDLLTAEGFNMWRALALGGFFAALMAIFIVTRNSLADEDSGQAELIASGVVGRETRLAVAVSAAAIASTMLGVVSFLGTIAFGAKLFDTFVLSATFTAHGLMFAGVAAITAQIASDARSANSLAVAILGALFITRGYFDASSSADWTAWLTPMGWMQETSSAGEYNLWPFLAAFVFLAVTLVIAFWLHSRRDFGSGLLAPKPGPAGGGALNSVWGLALRLNRGSVLSWLIGFIFIGIVFGYLTSSITDLISTDPAIAKFLAAGAANKDELLFTFVGTILEMIGIIAAVSGVQIVMRIYVEEITFRSEPLLASSLSRVKYFASNAVVAFLTSGLALLIGASVIGLISSALVQDLAFIDVLKQGLVTIPAVWTLVALALAVIGVEPGRRIAGWLGIVATFALTLLGPIFNLWTWVLSISPLYHVPNVTAVDQDWTGWWIVFGVTAFFTLIGFVGYRRRDIGAML